MGNTIRIIDLCSNLEVSMPTVWFVHYSDWSGHWGVLHVYESKIPPEIIDRDATGNFAGFIRGLIFRRYGKKLSKIWIHQIWDDLTDHAWEQYHDLKILSEQRNTKKRY